MRMIDQMFDIAPSSSEEVVNAENDHPVRQQTFTQVRTEETSTPGNQYARF